MPNPGIRLPRFTLWFACCGSILFDSVIAKTTQRGKINWDQLIYHFLNLPAMNQNKKKIFILDFFFTSKVIFSFLSFFS